MGAALIPALAASATLQVAQGFMQYRHSKDMDRVQRAQADADQRMLHLRSDDAIRRGQIDEGYSRVETQRVGGEQRAALAAQGIDPDSGSAGQIQTETQVMGGVDALTIRNNAWREAWGYRVEADRVAAESRLQTQAARRQRRATILTTGLGLAQTGVSAYGSTRGFTPRNTTGGA